MTFEGSSNPATLEALACREALSLALDLGLRKICVASDCLEVINNMGRQYLGPYSAILEEIKKTSA